MCKILFTKKFYIKLNQPQQYIIVMYARNSANTEAYSGEESAHFLCAILMALFSTGQYLVFVISDTHNIH